MSSETAVNSLILTGIFGFGLVLGVCAGEQLNVSDRLQAEIKSVRLENTFLRRELTRKPGCVFNEETE